MGEDGMAGGHDSGIERFPGIHLPDVFDGLSAVDRDPGPQPGDWVEVARAAGWLAPDGNEPTREGMAALAAAIAGDLDAVSSAFESFPPYAAVLGCLRDRGWVPRGALARSLRAAGVRISEVGAGALATAAVNLGQAFTTLGRVVDGSATPSSGAIATALAEAFEARAGDGLARMADIVPATCLALRVSPHRLGRMIEADRGIGTAAGLVLEPSAGGPPRGRDRILTAGEPGFGLAIAPIDRIHLGSRPVLVAMAAAPGCVPGGRRFP